MQKEEYLNRINANKNKIGMWNVMLGQNSQADFVMGYYFNQDSGVYDVYINEERGRHRIRLSTTDELMALEKLLSMIECRIESLQGKAMTSADSIIIRDCKLIFGEEYIAILDRLKNQIQNYSDLDKGGNAFITIGKVDLFEIKGEASLFFHRGVLDNIVLSPEWDRYNLVKPNGERLHIDEATYLVYKKCHDCLVGKFGPKVNDEYIPEIYEISQHNIATLCMSPGRDSVSLTIKRKEDRNG